MLGFSVEYNQTFNSHDDDLDEEYVSKINTSEIWMADERIEAVCRHLISNYHKKQITEITRLCLRFKVFQWRLNIMTYSKD